MSTDDSTEDSTYALSPCALCQFDVVSGDDILVGTILFHRRLRWNPDDKEAQRILKESIDNSVCKATRWPGLGGFRCYHAGCLDMADPEDEVQLLRFVEAMKYRRQPTLLQKEVRRQQLMGRLSTELLTHFALQGTHLPLELWHKIAEHMLPHYAAANARSLWKRPKPTPVHLAKDIWCEYVELEGIRYVARLSNTPFVGWELIYRPSGETIQYIFTGENHLGVMRVLFSTGSNVPQVDEAPGIWWRTVNIEDGNVALRPRSDGIKLRNFSDLPRSRVAWSIPMPHEMRLECLTVHRAEQYPPYMSSLVCNQPSVTGYSVLWAGRLVTIHAHRGIQDWSCYQSAATTGTWLHMPVDPGEVITEIWHRLDYPPRQRALGFKTSLGRVFIAGVYCDYLYSRPRWWSLLDRPGQTRMFFEDSDEEITVLAFEGPRPMGPNLAFPPHLPSAEPPIYPHLEEYFYFDHRLTGLERVTPCKVGNRPGFTGLMLHFANGHRESVGQVRLDCLCAPIPLQDSASWYLAFKKGDDGESSYLAAITATSPSPDADFEKVLPLSFRGRLEWFWSSRRCYVIHDETQLE
ncbi:hypothetical protein J3F83DRAFT_725345 [Trichoderma novae-zelandiae]